MSFRFRPHVSFARKQSRSRPRKLRCEAMEARRLLTASPNVAPTAAPSYWDIDGLPEPTEAELGARIVSGFRGELDSSYRATDFDSAQTAEQTLSEIAADYWSELFGREVSTELARELGISSFHYRIGWDGRSLDAFAEVAFSATNENGVVADATNIRVPGIDQADFAELIDGQLLVVAHGTEVSLFDVSDPSDITQVNQLDVGSGFHQFLTSGSQLIVVSSTVDPEIVIDTARWDIWRNRNWDTKSHVRVYDISNLNAIRQDSWVEVDGTIQEARLQDGRLMLSTGGRQDLPPVELVPVDGDEEGQLRFETQDEYLARVSNGLVASFVGQIKSLDGDGEVVASEDLGDFGDLQILDLDDATWGMRHSTMVMLEVNDGQLAILDSEVLVGFSQSFGYANEQSHFAVNAEWSGTSEIVSLSLSVDEIDYRAQGQVDGMIRSSHAMDEQDGYLRVFTTRNIWGAVEQGADVWVLNESDGKLQVVGELKDIADGQGQFGSVFMGDIAYVTTAEFNFEQMR
ncbi:MAG: beta-propeller domain-containing protein, partial [Planctomycetota bacterium]